MNFDDLESRTRWFETANDLSVLPGILMVARIDGRGFTRLTKEVHKFDAPFDERFRDHMVQTTRHLMNCGFRVVFGYTQSDEISLHFHRKEGLFERKLRKYHSVLAGEASACFSTLLGAAACFDCRISQVPSAVLVVEYFRWRAEDAHRNSLNAHCYWALRKAGATVHEATDRLCGLSVSEKNEMLFQRGVNFDKLPSWQKRGIGIVWKEYEKQSMNPKTGEPAPARRRRLEVDLELPVGSAFQIFLERIAASADTEHSN